MHTRQPNQSANFGSSSRTRSKAKLAREVAAAGGAHLIEEPKRPASLPAMSRSCGALAVSVLLMLAVSTASAGIAPTDDDPQDDKRVLMAADLHKEESDARLAAAGVEAAALSSVRTAEKKDVGGDAAAALPVEGKPAGGGVAIQGEDTGTVPSGGGGSASGSGSGEHGKEESGSGSSKEGEKAAKSCLSKEECHKKRLLCGKGCTLSAHAKCAAKCSKSCIPTC